MSIVLTIYKAMVDWCAPGSSIHNGGAEVIASENKEGSSSTVIRRFRNLWKDATFNLGIQLVTLRALPQLFLP